MNRVLLFIDDDVFSQKEPTGDYVSRYMGLGLGNDVVTVTSVARVDKDGKYELLCPIDEVRNLIQINEGDRALIVGKKAWNIFSECYHNGLRSENGFDATKLDRLGIGTGAYVKVLWRDKEYGMDKLSNDDLRYFMSGDFIKTWDYKGFKQIVVSDFNSAMSIMNFFTNLPDEVEFGFDYETNGMSDIPNFEITGCSICTDMYGAFFSFTDIRRYSTAEQYKEFCDEFARMLVKLQKRLWAYNLQFETHVTYRYFGVLIEINDSSVYNIIEGYHTKKYSLKWTAQRVLNSRYKKNSGIKSWDEELSLSA